MLPALDRGVFALVIEQPNLGGVGIDTVLLVFDKGIVFPAVSQSANHIDELRGGLWKTGSANHLRLSGSYPFKAKSTSCEIDRCNFVLPEQRLRAMSKEVMTSFPITRKLR
jgi:hypothetical protein